MKWHPQYAVASPRWPYSTTKTQAKSKVNRNIVQEEANNISQGQIHVGGYCDVKKDQQAPIKDDVGYV